jgi:GT2 family glycosyltransferase/predicted O-methyltransferase YrrM
MPCSAVSVIVLSHDRPWQLQQALDSLKHQTFQPAEILVINNRGAASAEVATVVQGHSHVRLVANPLNSGFTGGMNLGIRLATCEYLFLTEDDIVLAPDCLQLLREEVSRQKEAGILTGVMVDADRHTILYAGGSVTLGGTYRHNLTRRGETVLSLVPQPYDTGYVTGAMIFAPRSLWIRLGGFRDDFFLYHDDTEFSLRAIKAGFRITVIPGAREKHLPGLPGPVPEFIEYHKIKNFVALYLLHADLRVLPEFLTRYVLLPLILPPKHQTRRIILRAIWWDLCHSVRLLRDRGRVRPSVAGAVTGLPPGWPASSLPGVSGRGLRDLFHRFAPKFIRNARVSAVLRREAKRLAAEVGPGAPPTALWEALRSYPTFLPPQRKPEILRFLTMVRDLAPERIGEIGTASGGTAFLLSRCAPPRSRLVTLDIGTRAGQPEALSILAGSDRAIISLIADSHRAETAKQFGQAAGGALDVLLIDGDHSYEGVSQDFERYRKLVRPGGLIAFHDIVPDSRSRGGPDTGTDAGGVPTFWRELVDRYPAQTTAIVEREDQDACGIGVLRVQ